MTVYVSETRPCKFRRWREYAYLLADELAELHGFAQSIGLERRWSQDSQTHPHYDLFGSMITKARGAGAVQTTVREWLRGRVA